MPEKISIAQLLADALESRLRDLHISMPAKVDRYDAASQKVDVTLQFEHQIPDGEDGYTTEQYPKLTGVPVGFPRGGGFFCAFPLQVGDFVTVNFSERSLGAWLKRGEVSDPGDLTMHGLAGAWAYPGVAPDANALSSPSSSTMKMGRDGAPAGQIECTTSQVLLGGGSQFVALANKVALELGKIATTLNSLAGATFGTPYTAASVAAANVKAT